MRFLCLFLIACGPLSPGAETLTTLEGQSLIAAGGGQVYGSAQDGVWKIASQIGQTRVTIVGSEPVYDLLLDGATLSFTQGKSAAQAKVRRAGIDGQGTLDLATGAKPGSLRQDATNLYWIDHTAEPHGIYRVAKTGGTPVKVADAGLTLAPEIAVDDSHVYWLEATEPPSIKRVAKSGGAVAVFLAEVSPSSLVSSGGDLFFLDSRDGASQVFAVNKASGERKEVVRDANRFWLDDTYVYFTTYSRAKNTRQSFKRFERTSNRTDILLDTLTTLSLIQVAFDTTHVIWADGEQVRRLQKPTASN